MYFYIQENPDWEHEKKVKYGITSSYKKRINTDQHSYRTKYISIYHYQIKQNEIYKCLNLY